MSWNNVIPAWVIAGDSIITKYYNGEIDYASAKSKLVELDCPPSMIARLDEKQETRSD